VKPAIKERFWTIFDRIVAGVITALITLLIVHC
jgi:hypothetical protein